MDARVLSVPSSLRSGGYLRISDNKNRSTQGTERVLVLLLPTLKTRENDRRS